MTISEYEETRKTFEALRKQGFMVRIVERDIGYIEVLGKRINRLRVSLSARKPGFRNPPDVIGIIEEAFEPTAEEIEVKDPAFADGLALVPAT